MPKFKCAAFSLRVLPFGLLHKPERPHPFPRSDDYGLTVRPRDPTQRPMARMSIITIFSRPVMRSLSVRNRIRARIKTAVGLVAVRNAHLDCSKHLVINEGPPDPDRILLKDWCYIFTPAAVAYRMPMEELVGHASAALTSIKRDALKREALWSMPQLTDSTSSSRQTKSSKPQKR